jgi:hypothetical protein
VLSNWCRVGVKGKGLGGHPENVRGPSYHEFGLKKARIEDTEEEQC